MEQPKQGYNLAADKIYSNTLLVNLNEVVIRRNMYFDFSHLIESRCIEIEKSAIIRNYLH